MFADSGRLSSRGSALTRRGESLQHSSAGAQEGARSPPGLERGQFGGREPFLCVSGCVHPYSAVVP